MASRISLFVATIAFPEPLLFCIDPLSIRALMVHHDFTSLQNTVGITELAPDSFYVHGQGVGGGPFRVNSVDMRHFLVLPNGTIYSPATVQEIISMPEARAPNGMIHLAEVTTSSPSRTQCWEVSGSFTATLAATTSSSQIRPWLSLQDRICGLWHLRLEDPE